MKPSADGWWRLLWNNVNILSASELYSEVRLKQYVLYSVIFIIVKKIEKRKKESKAKDFHLVLFLDVKKKNPCISWSFTMSCTIKGLFENSEMLLWGPPPTRGREVSFRWWRVGGCGPHSREREHSSQRTRQCCSLLAGCALFDLPLCSPKLLKVPVWGPVWPESCHGNNRLSKDLRRHLV